MTACCRVCHRPLTNRESIARGIGPVCAMDYGRQLDMFASNATYNHEMRQAGKVQLLVIEDLDRGRSVTNDAENVLAEMAKEYGTLPAWIIYRDSEGNWDRIMATPEGKLIGFTIIARGHRPRTLDEALQLILELEGK